MFVQVHKEVLLALQLAQEVGREHLAQGALLGLGVGIAVHFVVFRKVRMILHQVFKIRLKTLPVCGGVREIRLQYFHKRQKSGASHIFKSSSDIKILCSQLIGNAMSNGVAAGAIVE